MDIAADTEYVAAYRAPTGTLLATPGGFSSGAHQRAAARAADAGAYTYSGDFPASSSSASYLVDVVFVGDGAAAQLTAQVPAPDSTGFPLTSKPSVTFSAPIQAGCHIRPCRPTAHAVAGTLALSADSRTITFTPAAPLPAGTAMTASVGNVVSTQGAALAPLHLAVHDGQSRRRPQSLFGSLLPAYGGVRGHVIRRAGDSLLRVRGRATSQASVLQGRGQHRNPCRLAVERGR